MSFDVSLEKAVCPHCREGGQPGYQFNLTHNLNGLIDLWLVEAGAPKARLPGSGFEARSWGRLHGWVTEDAAPILALAVKASLDPARQAEYQALAPANGWGSVAIAKRVLGEFYQACVDRPGELITASG